MKSTVERAGKSYRFAPAGAGLATAAVMLIGAALVRVPDAPPADVGSTPPDLTVARLEDFPAEGALRERMTLFDPYPLYLPMSSGGSASDSMPEAAAGEVARAVPPVLIYPDTRPTERLPRLGAPDTPAAAADLVYTPRWFSGMSKVGDAVPRPVVPVGPVCALRRAGDNQDTALVPLPSDPGLEQADWPPAEFTVLVDATGSALLASAADGSGAEDIDEAVRARLRRDIIPALRLRPGLYRAVISP